MNDKALMLADPIQTAKEAEQKAAELYANAAQQTPNRLGRSLFEKPAEFERHHFNKLVNLEKPLREKGAFIEREGRQLDFPTSGEVKSSEEPEKKSAMAIITMAIDIEREAENRYTQLATQTKDADGRSMLERLAEEEHNHCLIFSNAYWSLNDRGVWEVAE